MTAKEPTRTDRDRLKSVTEVLKGDSQMLKNLTERNLGTRNLDEADRRTQVIWEWREENDQI